MEGGADPSFDRGQTFESSVAEVAIRRSDPAIYPLVPLVRGADRHRLLGRGGRVLRLLPGEESSGAESDSGVAV